MAYEGELGVLQLADRADMPEGADEPVADEVALDDGRIVAACPSKRARTLDTSEHSASPGLEPLR